MDSNVHTVHTLTIADYSVSIRILESVEDKEWRGGSEKVLPQNQQSYGPQGTMFPVFEAAQAPPCALGDCVHITSVSVRITHCRNSPYVPRMETVWRSPEKPGLCALHFTDSRKHSL